MSQVLHLEYACTDVEYEEAEKLTRPSRLGQICWVLLAAAIVIVKDTQDHALNKGPLLWPFFVAALAIWGVLQFIKFKRPEDHIKLDISDSDIKLIRTAANVTFPWAGFGRWLESSHLFILFGRRKAIQIIVPKRVFPSESWLSWFREQAKIRITRREPSPIAAPAPELPAGTDPILMKFQLGLRDHCVRVIASCWLPLLFIGVSSFVGVMCIVFAIKPPPHAVNSASKVFFTMELYFLGIFACITPFVAIIRWMKHINSHSPQELALSDESIKFHSRDGSGVLSWSTFKYYKETPWCFFLFQGAQFITLPKRAVTSAQDLIRCRDLIARHSKRSFWFF